MRPRYLPATLPRASWWMIGLFIGMALGMAASCTANAQGVDMRFDKQSCYSWEGGLGAQGSFTSCDVAVVAVPHVIERETVKVVQAPPAPPVAVQCVYQPPVVHPKPKPKHRPHPAPPMCK